MTGTWSPKTPFIFATTVMASNTVIGFSYTQTRINPPSKHEMIMPAMVSSAANTPAVEPRALPASTAQTCAPTP